MSRELSNWQELLDSFTKTGLKQGKVNKIHQIKNSNADRIKEILQDEELRYVLKLVSIDLKVTQHSASFCINCRGVLIKWMNHQIKREQSDEATKYFREVGNRQFSLKDYSSCIETYTQSILSCPEESEVEKSLALANCSAALFQLELYEDCLEDIKLAIKTNYPSHLLPKLSFNQKNKIAKKIGHRIRLFTNNNRRIRVCHETLANDRERFSFFHLEFSS
jgi:tetratricopeptide (TPR) repeat protein